MRRRSSRGAGPVLIGAAVVLLALVGVVLVSAADRRPPSVRTFDVRAQLPTAQDVRPGDDVRLGGTRIGKVTDVVPTVDRRTGRIVATLELRLDPGAGPLPRDSTVLVRSRSALGRKDVELTRGRSRRTLAAGGTLPLSQARVEPVDLAQGPATPDDRTRRASRESDRELGDGLAGRGTDLGEAVDRFGPLLERLAPVMANLGDPRTGLTTTVGGLRRTAGEVAPVAGLQAGLLRHLRAALAAPAAVPAPELRDAITAGVPLQTSIGTRLPTQRPFLRRTRRLTDDLRSGLRALRVAAPGLVAALRRGTTAVPRLEQLDGRLNGSLGSLDALAKDPTVARSLDAQTRAASVLRPVLDQLAPAQATCNAITLFARNVAGHLSEGNRYGTWQRILLMLAPQQTTPTATPAADLNYDPYPNAGQAGVPVECESGNEPYAPAGRIGNVPGDQGTTVDRTPGPERR
ncbi:MlaD family protein [Patulibacter sp.]|uniref:MlaD family protein n=1 Tax=Patulibacter sp. TaxID=1912859 RepID=UPI00271AF49F|nr:MlaD family protein [Patulibacter sp.]MDO9408711.1 MlaD family protein [Patulibacter sp.]